MKARLAKLIDVKTIVTFALTAAYGMPIVFDYDNYILQLCYRYDTQSLYVRHSASTGSSWGTWKELQLGS